MVTPQVWGGLLFMGAGHDLVMKKFPAGVTPAPSRFGPLYEKPTYRAQSPGSAAGPHQRLGRLHALIGGELQRFQEGDQSVLVASSKFQAERVAFDRTGTAMVALQQQPTATTGERRRHFFGGEARGAGACVC